MCFFIPKAHFLSQGFFFIYLSLTLILSHLPVYTQMRINLFAVITLLHFIVFAYDADCKLQFCLFCNVSFTYLTRKSTQPLVLCKEQMFENLDVFQIIEHFLEILEICI